MKSPIISTTTTEGAEKGLAESPVTLCLPGSQNRVEVEIATFKDFVGRLMAREAVRKKVLETAKIEEVRAIHKKSALKYLILTAIAAGINPDELVLTEEWVDSKGELLKLEARYDDIRAANYTLITYQLKRDEKVDETNVDISIWPNGAEYPEWAEVIAKYVDDRWLLIDDSKPKGHKWVVQSES